VILELELAVSRKLHRGRRFCQLQTHKIYILTRSMCECSTVTLSNSLDLVLLPDGIWVRSGTLCRVYDFISKSLLDALQWAERGLFSTEMNQVNSLVDSAQGGDIDGLSAYDTTWTNTGWIFTSASVHNCIDKYLNGVETSKEVNQVKGLTHNFDGKLLLTCGSSTCNHNHVDKALNEGALHFLESSLLVASSGVRHKYLLLDCLDLDVSSEGNVWTLNTIVGPFSEQFWHNSVFGSVIVWCDFFTVCFHHLL